MSVHCEHEGDWYDDEFTEWDSVTDSSGYFERPRCPVCGESVGRFGLTELSQLMGGYLLSVADEDWHCSLKGAYSCMVIPAYDK